MSTVKEELVLNLKDILSFGKVFPIDDYSNLRENLTERETNKLKKTWESVYNSVSFMADRVESFNFDVDSAENDETNDFISSYKNFKNDFLKAGSVSNEQILKFLKVLDSDASSLEKLFSWNEGNNQILVTIQILAFYFSI